MIIRKAKKTDTGIYVEKPTTSIASPYSNTISLIVGAGSFVDIDRPTYRIKIDRTSKDSFYTVEMGYENRIDLIAYKFYGCVNYWWVICDVNFRNNPFILKVGEVLRIPDKDTVDRVLISLKNVVM